MPKQVPKEVLETNEKIILDILDTFGRTARRKGYQDAAAVDGLSHNLVATRMKPVLRELVRGREDLFRERVGVNPFLSEASGTYARYQLATAITAVCSADIEGTPFENLAATTFTIIDREYMPNYFRTKGTKDLPGRPVPLERARATADFNKYLAKILARLSKHGDVNFDQRKGMVYGGKLEPRLLMAHFYKDILHRAKSSVKRTVFSMKAGRDAPELRMMFSLVRDVHMGREIGIKREDVTKWYMLTGEEGAQFAYRDTHFRVHLQYEKAGTTSVDWKKEESEAFHNITRIIRAENFVPMDYLRETFPKEYTIALGIWNENPWLSPLTLAGTYLSRETGAQLGWSSKEPLGAEEPDLAQHNARSVLSRLWDELNPHAITTGRKYMDQIDEAHNVVLTSLIRLSNDGEFTARTTMEKQAMGVLGDYVENVYGNRFTVKKGMEDAVRILRLYSGAF